MLKHIKDIRSPIAVAQQKHAARKASSVISQESTVTNATQGHHKQPSASRITHRPPRLEVQDLSATTPTMSTGLSPQPGWPEASMLSPAGDPSRHEDILSPSSASAQMPHLSTSTSYSSLSGSTLVSQNANGRETARSQNNGDHGTDPITGGLSAREMPPASSNGVSYAVAIYPYMAEQEDEFDVVV